MRKKLMSLIVAAAFVLSIASPAAFAAPSSAGTAATAQSNSSGVLDDKSSSSLVVTPPNDSVVEGEVNKIVGRFTAIYNYTAGILTTVIGADSSITLIENGQLRASYLKNENGTYSIGSFNFKSGDYDVIMEMGGIKNFLIAIGAENFLNVEDPYTKTEVEYNEDGSVKSRTTKREQEIAYGNDDAGAGSYQNRVLVDRDLAWLGVLEDHLAKGINYGASIDFQASGGASVTLFTNGQAQITYAAQGDFDNNPIATTRYMYENGFLSRTLNLTYEVDLKALGDEYKDVQEKYEQQNGTLTDEDKENIRAQTSGAAKFTKTYTTSYMGPYGNPAYTTDTKGNIVSRYAYSSNGSVEYIEDLTTKTKSYFENGQFSFSVNYLGFVTAKMFYHQNGTQNYMLNYNDGVATSMTVFLNNQAALTVSMVNQNIPSADELREVYKDIKDPNYTKAAAWLNNEATAEQKDGVKKIEEMGIEGDSAEVRAQYAYVNHLIEKWGITSFSVYAHDMNNKALMRILGLDKNFEKKLMEIEEKEAQEDQKVQEAAANEYWNKLTDAEKEALGKYSDKDLNEEKNQEELKEKSASLSENAKEYAKYKTGAIEAKNRAESNSSVNRVAAMDTIDKAREIIRKYNNGHAAVINATFNLTHPSYYKDGETTYINDNTGQEITAAEADALLNKGDEYKDGGTHNYHSTLETHTESITKKTTATRVDKTVMSISLSISAYGQAKVGYSATHTLRTTETKGVEIANENLTNTWKVIESDPVVIGTQGGFVGSDGKALVNADGTAMTNEQIAEFIANGGVVYVSVNASDVNIMDGQGFQAVDGEEILVQVTDVDVFNSLAENVGKEVMLMGNVRNDVDGKKAIVMDLSYGGGFQTGTAIGEMKDVISKIEAGDTELSARHAWVQQNLDANSWLSGVSGSLDAKWNLLVINGNSGGALEKTPRALLQIMAAVLAVF